MRIFKTLFTPLSSDVRNKSMRDCLCDRDITDGVWVFAYGSLMWDPGFAYVDKVPARLRNWHRAMCIWTTLARGTLAYPGLGLGLLPGNYCDGILFKIAPENMDEALKQLWEREMWTDVYRPSWFDIDTADANATAITFTANSQSIQFADRLSPQDTASYIAQAVGERGSCIEYLNNTIAELRHLNIEEPQLQRLQNLI